MIYWLIPLWIAGAVIACGQSWALGVNRRRIDEQEKIIDRQHELIISQSKLIDEFTEASNEAANALKQAVEVIDRQKRVLAILYDEQV